MDDGSPPGSRLELLVKTRHSFTLALGALAAFVTATALVDLWIGGAHPSRRLTLTCQLLYAFSASLLATLLISRVLVAAQIANQRTRAHALLGVLGILRELEDQRVAIVVPAFPVAALGDRVAHDEGPIRTAVQRELGFVPSETLKKEWNEIGDYAYSRRDILLVTDIVRLTSAAGLPPPLVVSDVDFSAAFNGCFARPDGIRIQPDKNDPESARLITAAVVVGLWSNVMTCLLSDSENVPFTLAGAADARQVELEVPECSGGETHPSRPRPDESDRAHGLFARLYFEDFTFVVLGGIMSLGTARIGDMITRRPAGCRDLWNVPTAHEVWAMVQFPGAGHRGGPHGLVACHHRRRRLNQRLNQALRIRTAHIDLVAEGEAGQPVGDRA